MASTRALLAAPRSAFDDRGVLVWDTNRPLMVDEADAATFDIKKYGFVDVPGRDLIEPSQDALDRYKADVYESFGITKIIAAETGNMRDVGEPGLTRANLLMEFTTNEYQKKYAMFLSQAINVSREFARNWLNYSDLPDSNQEITFKWEDFAPESDLEKAQTAKAKMDTGLPARVALEEQGYKNVDELMTEKMNEINSQTIIPHSPYSLNSPDEEIEAALDEIIES